MYELKEYAIARVASLTIDFTSVAAQTLYTVPTGKSFIPCLVVIRNASGNFNDVVCTFGVSTAKTDFRPATTLSGISGTTKAVVLYPNYNATPAAGSGLITVMAAGALFQIDITTGEAMTGIVDVFGYLY
jgi:hypothetical protein